MFNSKASNLAIVLFWIFSSNNSCLKLHQKQFFPWEIKKINLKIQKNWATKGEILSCFIPPVLSSVSIELQNLFSTMISLEKIIFKTVRITSIWSFCPLLTRTCGGVYYLTIMVIIAGKSAKLLDIVNRGILLSAFI